MTRTLLRGALALVFVVCALPAAADEGMWMLHQIAQLDQSRLQELGLELTPQQIWDDKTGTGLASAIVSLGGCSASFVSPEGLVATNHHCAYRAIQSNSSAEHDYITDGFLAAGRGEELEAKGYRVFVFRGFQDVSAKIKAAYGEATPAAEREKAIEKREKELIAECEKDGLTCKVATMFGGGASYLFRTLELRDVRLVYAPPRGVGEYGGEVDNWMWPRHTGDFSFLRAYIGRDGKPADFAKDNVPYQPERWLKVAQAPVKPGDFTMIMGYPGRTMRYRTSAAIDHDLDFYYPRRIEILHDLIGILEEQGTRGKDVEITLASTLKGFNNSYKNNQGMLDGLRALGLAGEKRTEETALEQWIAADPTRAARWGGVVAKINALVAERNAKAELDLMLGWLPPGRSSSLLSAANTIQRWVEEQAKPDADRALGYQTRDARNVRQRLERMQRDLELTADRAMHRYLLLRAAALPAGQRIAAVDQALAATGATGEAAVDALLDRLFSNTALADRKARVEMLSLTPEQLAARHDAMIDFAIALRQDDKAREAELDRIDGELLLLVPREIEALAAFRGAPLYPDANSTLRFTYATVKGYSPRDAVLYLPFTTLSGVVAKDTGVEPFDSPKALLEQAGNTKASRYRDARLGDVPSCFLTTNDITGGNSGSPIMNGKGELIGLAFDGNYEAMTSDYRFTDGMSRTINVDARYMLWVMDHVDRAHNLLREMGIEPEAR